MKHKLLLKSLLLLCALIVGSGTSWATDVETTSFTQTSGKVGNDNNVTFTTYQGGGTSSPTITSNCIRLYQKSGGGLGGYIVIGVPENYVITAISITPNATTKAGYMLTNTDPGSTTPNANSFAETNHACSANTAYSVTDISSQYVVFGNFGDSKNNSTRRLDIKAISVTYQSSGGGSLTTSDLAITGAPVALNFDLYNSSSAQTVSYTTSSTGNVTVSGGDGYVTTSVNSSAKTVTVTPTAVTPSAQTITISQEADATYAAGSATFTVNITNSTPVQLTAPTLTALPSNNTVTLEWEAISNASSYTIQYADNESFTGATTIENATSPKDITGLTNGTTYYFKAMSVGNGNNYLSSNYGDAVSAIPNNVVKITITQDSLTNFTNSYAWYDWTAGGVSGRAYAYKNSGMQFNSGKDGYWIYNTSAIPGTITSVKMVKASGTDRNWTLKAGTSAISTTSGGTAVGGAQTVGTSGTTWNVTGSNNYFCLIVSGGATTISSIEISYIPTPTISVNPTSLTGFTYVAGSGSSTAQTVSVSGSNLTANIGLSLDDNSKFEMSTDLDTWTNSLTLTETDGSVTDVEVAIRLKVGLSKGDYNETLTLSSEDAEDIEVSLSGSVTGQTYTVTYDANGGTGTMTDNNSYEEGDDVTLLDNIFSAPEGKMWSSWVVTNASSQSVTVTDGKFTMPASNVTVTAQWTDIPTYTAHFSINGFIDNDDDCTVAEGVAITFPSVTAPTGFTFMGWTTSTINGSQNAAPATLVSSANMGSADVNYYAVFAIGTGSAATLTMMGSSDTFNDNDKIVVVAKNTNYGMYQETTNNSYVNNWSFVNNVENVAADDKNWWTLSSTDNDKWYIGDATNGYLYNSGNNLYASDNQTAYDIQWDLTESAFTIDDGARYVSCRTDLSGNNQNLYRMGGANYGTSGIIYFNIYKYNTGNTTYSNYCTTTTGTITLNSACHDGKTIYGTYYTNRAYVMPATLKGSVVSVDNDGKLAVDAVYDGSNDDVVPANVALLISTTDEFTGSKDYTITYSTGGDDYSEYNMLKGTLTADDTTTGDGCLFYRLTMHKPNTLNKIGFWWGAANGGAFKPGAHKAYLAVPQAQAQEMNQVQGFSLFDDGATTAIDALNDERESLNDGAIYDLAGRRITNGQSSMLNGQSLPKGIYVKNGKKFIVK